MISRRTLLAGAGGALANLSSLSAFAAPQGPGLAALAGARNILFGTAAASYELRDADFPPLLAREAAILVPEYEMKRHVVEPHPGVYDFSGLDQLFAFAAEHRMAMRGHPLVWYNANPPWLEDALSANRDEKLLTGYVAAVAGRYRGRLHSVDVVNEALAQPGDNDRSASGLRPSFWLKAFGPAYLDMAFHAARAADPNTLLVYNDYGFEPANAASLRANCLNLLDGLLKRGAPVQALGIQGHLSAFRDRTDQKSLRAFLAEVEARRLQLLVTELDVDDEGGAWDVATRDQAVTDEATRFLDVVLDCSNLHTVLTWGLTDRYADPSPSARRRLVGWWDRKFPYDADLRPKPLRAALARAFAGRRTP